MICPVEFTHELSALRKRRGKLRGGHPSAILRGGNGADDETALAEKLSVRLAGTEFVSIDADIPVGAVYQSKFGTVRITAQRSVGFPIGPYFSEKCAESLAAEIRPGEHRR